MLNAIAWRWHRHVDRSFNTHTERARRRDCENRHSFGPIFEWAINRHHKIDIAPINISSSVSILLFYSFSNWRLHWAQILFNWLMPIILSLCLWASNSQAFIPNKWKSNRQAAVHQSRESKMLFCLVLHYWLKSLLADCDCYIFKNFNTISVRVSTDAYAHAHITFVCSRDFDIQTHCA